MSSELGVEISGECEKQIINLYKEGYSQKDIQKQLENYKVSLKNIRFILSENGFLTHNYRCLPVITKDIIELLIYEGYSYQKISMILDISFHVIREISESRSLEIGKKKREKCDLNIFKQERFSLNSPVHFSCYTDFVEEYKKGESFFALYEKFNLGMQDVCYLANMIYEKKDLLAMHELHLKERITSMLKEGFPIHMIAKKLNISLSIVKKQKKNMVS